MAYVSPTYVKKMQSTHNAEFWRLYNNTGKELINECCTHIGLSASIDMLEEALENCAGASSVLVKLYTVKPERTLAGQSKGDTFELRVKLDGENNSGNFTQRSFNPSMGAPTWVDMMQMSDRIRQTELDKLRLELEQKDESPWTAIANKLLENDALILAIAGLIKKPIAQTTRQISAPQNENDLFNRLNNIGFSNTDIENMATYLEENPGVIDQIKPIFSK
jgi:hypothetical protein